VYVVYIYCWYKYEFGAQHLLIIRRGDSFVYVVYIYCWYKYEFSLICYYHIYWVPKIEMHARTYGANQSQNPQSEGVLEISWFETCDISFHRAYSICFLNSAS